MLYSDGFENLLSKAHIVFYFEKYINNFIVYYTKVGNSQNHPYFGHIPISIHFHYYFIQFFIRKYDKDTCKIHYTNILLR